MHTEMTVRNFKPNNCPHIETLIKKAIMGQSPFNMQDWKFIFRKGKLEIHLDKERVTANMNAISGRHILKEHYIGAGTAIENIAIGAQQMGFKTNIEYSNSMEDWLVARIYFEKKGAQGDWRDDYIDKRWSNRFAMNDKAIPKEDLERLISVVEGEKDFGITVIDDSDTLKKIADLSAKTEGINWTIKPLQQKAYKNLRFSEKDTVDGVPLWYFGMPKFLAPFLKIFLKWGIVRLLNIFGFSKMVGRRTRGKKAKKVLYMAHLYSKQGDVKKQWILGGRIWQRLCLEATAMGVAIQPYNVLYLWTDVCRKLGDPIQLSEKRRKEVFDFHQEANSYFDFKDKYPLMIFAMGYNDGKMPPPVRRPIGDVFKSEKL